MKPAELTPIYTTGRGQLLCSQRRDRTPSHPAAWQWWIEFNRNDPYCKANLEGEAKIIQQVAHAMDGTALFIQLWSDHLIKL